MGKGVQSVVTFFREADTQELDKRISVHELLEVRNQSSRLCVVCMVAVLLVGCSFAARLIAEADWVVGLLLVQCLCAVRAVGCPPLRQRAAPGRRRRR